MYANVKSLHSTPETNMIYIKYISMKEKKSRGENMSWETGLSSDPSILFYLHYFYFVDESI